MNVNKNHQSSTTVHQNAPGMRMLADQAFTRHTAYLLALRVAHGSTAPASERPDALNDLDHIEVPFDFGNSESWLYYFRHHSQWWLCNSPTSTMNQQPKPTDTQPPSSLPPLVDDLPADPTMICWTQLLRETESEPGPPLPLPPLPDDFSIEKLFS